MGVADLDGLALFVAEGGGARLAVLADEGAHGTKGVGRQGVAGALGVHAGVLAAGVALHRVAGRHADDLAVGLDHHGDGVRRQLQLVQDLLMRCSGRSVATTPAGGAPSLGTRRTKVVTSSCERKSM